MTKAGPLPSAPTSTVFLHSNCTAFLLLLYAAAAASCYRLQPLSWPLAEPVWGSTALIAPISSLQPLSAGRELGTALPHAPSRVRVTRSSAQAAARGAGTEGRTKVELPQKRPFEGVTAFPFSGWLVSLSEPPSCPRRPPVSGHALVPPPEGAAGTGSGTSPR